MPRRDPYPFDDDDRPIRRRPRRRAGGWSATKLALVLTTAAVGVAAAVLLVIALTSRSAPLADLQGHTWEFRDLTRFLNAKGLAVEMKYGGDTFCGYVSPRYPERTGFDWNARRPIWENVGEVTGTRHESALDAREAAARARGKGNGAFAWGRFSFAGGPDGLREEIRRALRADAPPVTGEGD